MSSIAQQGSFVKASLFQFITKYIPTADLNVIDDIVLSYVISILEEASQDPCFDVEGTEYTLILIVFRSFNLFFWKMLYYISF